MKKYLFFFSLLLLGSARIYGQSIKFDQLVYLATLNNESVYSTLKQGNAFKQDYSENVDGQEMEYFNSKGPKPGAEKIAVGSFVKLYNGTVLRTLDYTSTDVQNIINMIGQAKRYGLDLLFRGVDETDNIYLYASNFYMVSIRLRRDNTSGIVEIKQKESLGLE